ncbi:hypothetical protein Aab01nite_28830 [Paractinoplanes abujensis]|uniref:Uncharacterized protein n=1 Tax=Paractinoplanes abujensis TaxID=882441 RepID=A0A7W7D171_9ACTN|nr:nucleotidyltransferase domain-containing protein [Actinoplanes abujensis]MBB4698221.1 hypothetical protein [Actinoplanes abujensis]GID19293.1 hypothetical protein Aab01nite_28830 [Actinoplanes abujensis]
MKHWRELKEDRLREAITVLGRVPGVRGFLIGGSLGRGDPWPMSDIDLLPVYDDPAADDPVRRGQLEMVDWWAGSGLAQSLDLSWLSFTTAEVRAAMAAGPEALAATITGDRRWFHGIDKAYGGRPSDPADDLLSGFAAWITSNRFHPAVVAARIAEWRRQAVAAAEAAFAAAPPVIAPDGVAAPFSGPLPDATDTSRINPDLQADAESGVAAAAEGARRRREATFLMRESARALRMVMVESWGERLGSMGREWTRFERMADQHGHRATADRIAVLAGADVPGTAGRAEVAPLWLRERVTLCWQARQAVGEPVTEAQNARDQVAAYVVHVTRHRPDLDGPWTATPDPDLDAHLLDLRRVIEELAGGV